MQLCSHLGSSHQRYQHLAISRIRVQFCEMSVQAILQELEGVKAYMAARPQTPGASDSVAKSFAASLVKMISVCNFISPHDAAKLSKALSDSSPYNESDTKKIRDVIDKKVGDMSIAKSQHKSSVNEGQLLEHWCNYLTQKDWDFLNDSRQHFSAKMTRFMERAQLLGVAFFDEKTYKWMLAVLLAVQYKETPDAHFIYDKLQELKKAHAAETKYYPHTFLSKYPKFPSELDSIMFAYAYPDAADKPVSVKLPGLQAIASRIPLRSNSKLLKEKSKPKKKRQLRQQSTDEEALPASAQPEGVVKAEPLHSQSKSSDTIDVEEQALLAKYYADLAELRKKRKQAYTMPSIAPTPCAGSIELRDSADGKITLQPIKYEGQGTVHAKEEPLGEQNGAVKAEPIPDTLPDEQNAAAEAEPIPAILPGSGVAHVLDPIAQAAVNALKVRNDRKKQQLNKQLYTRGQQGMDRLRVEKHGQPIRKGLLYHSSQIKQRKCLQFSIKVV